jgi:phosphoadenosine phosphosulfate reductase
LIGQLSFGVDGQLRDKVQTSIDRLRAFEPPEGYYVAVSAGGKDSECVILLCKMAGVKADYHYAITSCDPPEALYHLRKYHQEVKWERQYYDDNKPEHYYANGKPKPITMWSLIADHTLPPTRKVRYCCA